MEGVRTISYEDKAESHVDDEATIRGKIVDHEWRDVTKDLGHEFDRKL